MLDDSKLPKGIRPRGKRSYQIRFADLAGNIQEETVKGPTKSAAQAEAIRLLKVRQGALADGVNVSATANMVTFAELCKAVVKNYEARNLDSTADIEARFRLHLLAHFGLTVKAAALVDEGVWEEYIAHRKREGASEQTINLELQAARRAFLLGKERKKVMNVPNLSKLMTKGFVRKGFFEREQVDAVCRHLAAHLVPAVRFAYITGWRQQEVFTRKWCHVDQNAVRLDPGETKSGTGREFPLAVHELRELLESIRPKDKNGKPLPVFPNQLLFPGRDGKPVKRFDWAWATACRAAGLPVQNVPIQQAARNEDGTMKRSTTKFYPPDKNGQVLGHLILEPVIIKRGPKKGQVKTRPRAAVFFHDFRRTAYRNLIRLGVTPKVARTAVGWDNAATADRYDIIAKADLDALANIYNQANPVDRPATNVVNFPK
jgi:integrase